MHCPKGVDIYFDNVGGEILDLVLAKLAPKARIVICGAISQYNDTTPMAGPKNYMSLLVNRARMEGMVVFDYTDRFPQAIAELAGYRSAAGRVSGALRRWLAGSGRIGFLLVAPASCWATFRTIQLRYGP